MRLLPLIVLALVACNLLRAVEPTQPADLSGGPDGRLHLAIGGVELCGFAPFTADAQWKFAGTTAVGPVPEAPEVPFRFTLKLGKDSIPGTALVTEKDGLAEAVWTFTPTTAAAFNALAVTSELSIAALGGGTWETDQQHGTFPLTFGGQSVLSGEARVLSVGFPDGRSLKLTFAQPTWIVLQDNRQWGGQTYSMRLGKAIGRLAAKETFALGMTISVNSSPTSSGLRYRRDLPVTIVANDEWIPLHTELDIVPGSALDLSACGLTDGPCGDRGRVITTPDGHFAYAKEPQTPRRFYGVNLCFSAQYLSKEQADQLLDRLVRLGYNTVRIHHYEFHLTASDWQGGFTWDPAHVDQLDYLMAGCAKRGLWLTTDLYVSRPVSGKQIGLTGDKPDPGRFKLLVPVYEPAYQDWETFARKFLDRVNPYTGRRVAEEPALAWLSLINEGPVAGGWDEARRIPEWTTAWNRWLAKQYATREALALALGDLAASEDPAAGSVILPEKIRSDSRRARIGQVFLADTERALVERMRTFLRDQMKCQALLTDINCGGPTPVPMQAARAEFDYVDEHFYVDHPMFGENQWHLPSSSANANPIRDGAPGGTSSASVRLWGKPFAVSEFNYSGPGRFRGVGGILTGALAALQDWDAVWRFAYSHKDHDLFTPAPIDYFNLVTDPLNQAADRAAVLLYLRRDLKTAPGRLAVAMPLEQLRNPPEKLALNGSEAFAWTTRIGSVVLGAGQQAPADAMVVPLSAGADRTAVAALLRERKLLGSGPDSLIRSETGEIQSDRTLGVLTIDTARTAGGYAEPGQAISATAAGVRIDAFTTGATMFVSSLDLTPLRNAKRILVTHLTDLQNSGAIYGESARQTLLAWGDLPHLVRDGAATIHLTIAAPATYHVWALSTSGRRLEEVPTTVANDGLSFTVRVTGADGARMLYEVVSP